jgi:LCP family protein required for cell wall assembly
MRHDTAARTPRPTLLLWSLLLVAVLAASCGQPVGTPAATGASTVSPAVSPRPLTQVTRQPTATSSPTEPPTATPAVVLPTATPSRTPTASPTVPTSTPTWTPTPLPPTPLPAVGSFVTGTITGTAPTPAPMVAFDKDTVNILLLGLDSTVNLGAQNSDVIIVVSVNKRTRQVAMLSIPRDLWVYIPTYGWNRINTAHRRGYSMNYPGKGPGLLADTIELNLGIPTQHWARVDFTGFQKVVDELGGVDMTVACPINLRYKKPTSPTEEEMILQPGVYHMDGQLALRYVRTRRGSSDFDRARRQQQFLKAMWVQSKDPGIILKIPGLFSALKGSVTTDLSLGDLLSMARVGIGIKPQNVHSYYIGANETKDWMTPQGWAVLLQRPDRIQKVVARFAAPQSNTEDQVASEGASVQVLNGTPKEYLSRYAADQLQWYGVTVTSHGNAPTRDHKVTQIIVYRDKPKAVALLASLLKVKPANIVSQPDESQAADIQVILGADYDPCQ